MSESLPLRPYQDGTVPDAEIRQMQPDAGEIRATGGEEHALRRTIATARTVVVKLGSSSLTNAAGCQVDPEKIHRIVDALQARMARGSNVIVVSSGAVAAGLGPLGMAQRPRDLATKQAAASVGQMHLAHAWGRSFARYGRTVGQVLLTAGDAGVRERARNAQRTIRKLLQLRAVPIINENDTVATSEFHFGDNDRLSAIVSHLIRADALVLLSDVAGLYDRHPAEPGARFLSAVRDAGDLEGVLAGDGSAVGTGGMAAKVSAARLAARGGIPVLLTSAKDIGPALEDARLGTVFYPSSERISAWKFWALYAADSGGVLRVDAGAARAVSRGGTSLLAVGITQVGGDFHAGEIVDILGPSGEIVGRGEVNYGSAELSGMIGKHTEELPPHLRRSVVHADYLSKSVTQF